MRKLQAVKNCERLLSCVGQCIASSSDSKHTIVTQKNTALGKMQFLNNHMRLLIRKLSQLYGRDPATIPNFKTPKLWRINY